MGWKRKLKWVERYGGLERAGGEGGGRMREGQWRLSSRGSGSLPRLLEAAASKGGGGGGGVTIFVQVQRKGRGGGARGSSRGEGAGAGRDLVASRRQPPGRGPRLLVETLVLCKCSKRGGARGSSRGRARGSGGASGRRLASSGERGGMVRRSVGLRKFGMPVDACADVQ